MSIVDHQDAALDADVYLSMFHRSLGIHLTMRCPLRCAHCSVDSGPDRHETVDGPLLLRRLEEAGRTGHLKRLSLSGGEPFLMRSLLSGILEIAERYGIATVINTAAHWASTRERARNALKPFPPIAELAVSADEYHLDFVPLENVRHAAEAGLDMGLVTSLVIRAWEGEDDPFVHTLRTAVGEDVWNRAKLEIDIIKHVGRGEALPRRTPPVPVAPEHIPEGYCRSADQAVIDHDGTVFACCNTAGARSAPHLRLGHLSTDSLPGITAKADRNLLLQAIRVWGPAALGKMIRDAGLGHRLAPHYSDRSICKMCTDICSKPDLVTFLEEALNDPNRHAELSVARLLIYGEDQPASDDNAEDGFGRERPS